MNVASDERDRLARALIEDAFTAMLADAHADLGAREAAVGASRRRLGILSAKQRHWRQRGTFDHVVGMRATAMAASADMAETDLPPGVNLRALTAYLNAHGLLDQVPTRASTAAQASTAARDSTAARADPDGSDSSNDPDGSDESGPVRGRWGRHARGSRRR